MVHMVHMQTLHALIRLTTLFQIRPFRALFCISVTNYLPTKWLYVKKYNCTIVPFTYNQHQREAATDQETSKQQLRSNIWLLSNGTVFSLKMVHMYCNMLQKLI